MKKITKLNTVETGLWLHPRGIFGASPDKLVNFADGSQGTVERECPFKYRNNVLSEVLKKDTKYIVTFDESGKYIINKEHNYYHQIQGQLHTANCTKGFLVLWTQKETNISNGER